MKTAYVTCDASGAPVGWADLREILDGAQHFIVLSHGWRESDEGAKAWFAKMTTGMDARLGDDVACACLHWPSDDGFGDLSYYVMEQRAALIGKTAAANLAIDAMDMVAGPLRVHFAGHSDGGIVSVNALARIGQRKVWAFDTMFALTLIEPACPSNYLESGQPGGPCLAAYPDVAVTLSDLDQALRCMFPIAERLECRDDCEAMGCVGPTARTRGDLNNARGTRLKLLDLTAAHASRPEYGPDHHCDIALPEVFDLLARK